MYKKLSVLFLSGILLTACGGKVSPDSANLEDLIPAESGFVMIIDSSDEGQKENFKNLFLAFPGGEKAWSSIRDEFMNQIDMGFRYDNRLNEELAADAKKIVNGNWKFGFTAEFTPDFIESLEGETDPDNVILEMEKQVENGEVPFYLFFETDEADSFENLLLAEESGLNLIESKSGDDDLKIWDLEWVDESVVESAIMRSGDVFVFSFYGDMDKITGLAMGETDGYLKTDDGEFLAESGLLKMVFSREIIKLGESFYGSLGVDLNESAYIESPMTYLVSAEDEGLRISSSYDFDEKIYKEDFNVNLEGGLSLAEKINGEGMIAYLEIPELGSYLDQMMESLANLEELDSDFGDLAEGFEFFKEFLAENLEIEYEDFLELLNGNMAFAWDGDEKSFLPGFSFYLEIGDEEETAEKLLAAMNELVETQLPAINEELRFELPDFEGKIVELKTSEDVASVQFSEELKTFVGENLREIAAADEVLAGILAEVDLEEQLETFTFKYGVTQDTLFISFLNHDLEAEFGENPLAENEKLEDLAELAGDIDLDDSLGILYFDGESLGYYIKKVAELSPEGKLFAPSITQYLDPISFFSNVKMKDGEAQSEFFLGIEGKN